LCGLQSVTHWAGTSSPSGLSLGSAPRSLQRKMKASMETYGIVNIQKIAMKGSRRWLRAHNLYVIPVLVEFAARLSASSNERIKLDARLNFLVPSPRILRNGISNRGGVTGKWGRIQNEGGAKVQSRVWRGRGHFIYFLKVLCPNSTSINSPYPPILPPPLQPSRYFSGSAWAQHTIGKEERGPRRPRLKIPGRNSHRRAELLVD
jgi:hypothetical protein